jgi:HPt (histidine-containing phosphotransfer) domain-containing protein
MITSSLDPTVLTSLRDLADGDQTFVDDLLQTYLEQGGETVEELRMALTQGNMGAARGGAHLLLGASLSVGASGAAFLCRRIEDAASRGDASEMSDCLAGLLAELAAIRAEV